MKQVRGHISGEWAAIAVRYIQAFMPEFTQAHLDQLMPYCEVRKLARKAILLNEGEQEEHLHIVLSGLVRKYILSEKGEITIELATEGHVAFSEQSFFTRRPATETLQCLEPVVLLSLSYRDMQTALSELPFGERLIRLILTWIYIRKDERRYAKASKTVRELFLDYLAHQPQMLQRVSQKHLSSYLGIKPETFSRLKHLARRPGKKNGSSRRN